MGFLFVSHVKRAGGSVEKEGKHLLRATVSISSRYHHVSGFEKFLF